jgi:acetylornithine deacetylase
MKAGLAAAVAVVERLAAEARAAGGRSPLRGDLLVAGCADEEWQSFGAEAVVSRYHPDAAILPECTDLEVTVEHGGFAWFELESRGVEAAGAEPDKGVDAIALLGPVLSGIAALDRELGARPRASYGRGSIHASTIAGGTQLPAYPGACRLGVERCLIAGESVARAQAEIAALITAARAVDPRFAASSHTVVGREPVSLSRDVSVVEALVAAATAELERAPGVRGDIRWGDSGIFAEAGIPCAQFGPIGGGEHTADEWVDVASVKFVARVLETTARRSCA